MEQAPYFLPCDHWMLQSGPMLGVGQCLDCMALNCFRGGRGVGRFGVL